MNCDKTLELLSAEWNGRLFLSSAPASASWRAIASSSTRTPIDEISNARPSTSFHTSMSPFSDQSS